MISFVQNCDFLFKVLFFSVSAVSMVSTQTSISIAFAIFNLFLLYYILSAIYIHLVLMLVIYVGYRYIQNIVEENIDITGQGVLITGCDSGKQYMFCPIYMP